MKKEERIEIFVSEIWQWYARHKRTLPWRDLTELDATQRAYLVFVSEIMLQQTQVPRVEVVYRRFLREFPDLSALAKASDAQIIVAWRGMGYNSRALRLRDAARTIQKNFNGIFPSEMDNLLSIKGIGHYTAGAVRNFAFHLPTPCIDTNIRRILHRVFIGPENPDGTWVKHDAELLKLAEEVLAAALAPENVSRFLFARCSLEPQNGQRKTNKRITVSQAQSFTADWHAALMDFGSLVCTKNNPKWDQCPLTERGICKAAYKVQKVDKEKKKEPGRLVGSVFIPNRIFRGRIIEQLRDTSDGLTFVQIGKRITVDWDTAAHRQWLATVLEKLQKDRLVMQNGQKYFLPH
jgi:A/G-specific adenine glycosylase